MSSMCILYVETIYVDGHWLSIYNFTVYYVQEGLLFFRRFMDLFYFRDMVVAAKKRIVYDHIVILGWFFDEDKSGALDIEQSNDSWTPRIELQGIFSYIFYYENFKSQMSSFPENERMLC